MILDLPLERWRRIEPILDQILDLPPAERQALLDSVCDGDSALRADVEAFLMADEAAGGFLDTPAGEYAVDLLDEEVEELPAGGQIGPYRLVREIGSGGMGVVYEAEDSRLRRRVAIKFLPPEYSRDRRAKERFLREARAASCLDHPNLCTVHDVGESDGRVYIVLAYYEGETLKERLRRGPLSITEARDVAIQVARGLACAHEAGIIHRDIKPANVMLTRRGEVKILDFGVAKQGGEDISLTPTGGSLGTPAYMSPEQVQGKTVDGRTDIWALGVMLYEMLAGRRPFGGEGVQAVLSAILTREPEPIERLRPEVPPSLARVVERALAKNPAERYGSAAGLLADLEAGRAPKGASKLHRLRRTKVLPAALAATAVLALLVVAWSLGWLPPRRSSEALSSDPASAPTPQIAVEPSLRVAVLRPVIAGTDDDPELRSVAFDVVDATLNALLSFEGIQPLDPPEVDEEVSSKAVDEQRAVEADEVLRPRLGCRVGWCTVTFLRSKPGGEVLPTSGPPFEVPIGIENAHELPVAVRAYLQQVYPKHRLRPNLPGSRVKTGDYSAYIDLERRLDGGERLGAAELESLDALVRSSPDLLGAWVLAAGIANTLGQNYQDRALSYAAEAERLATPYDPRPLLARVRAEVSAGQLTQAEMTLERLAKLAPTDTRVQTAKAILLEARGDLEEARDLREEVARRRPYWRPILDLVTLEFRMGANDSARRRLNKLLQDLPNSQWVLERRAFLETVYGDPLRAAAIYEQLIEKQPERTYLTNLGFVRYLLGDYAAAIQANRQALAREPAHLLTRLNLAAALHAQGDQEEARRRYRILEEEIKARPNPSEFLLPMLRAQCLAQLDRRDEAARLAEEDLKQWPEDIQVLYHGALVYALLREPVPAVYWTEKALKKGLRREWFMIPEFRSLEKDPKFQALLASHAPKP